MKKILKFSRIDQTGKLTSAQSCIASDLWRLSCLEQHAKLTWQTLGPFELPEVRRAICMVNRVKLLDVNVTQMIMAVSNFLRYLGN